MIKNYKNIDCHKCSNSKCFIKLCDAEYISSISNLKNYSTYKKGQNIIIEGTTVFGVYFIQQGKVKVISSNLDRKEHIVRLANNGHILGHRGYGSERYPIGAVAMVDSQICFFDNEILFKIFMNNRLFTYNIMMFYSKELRNMELRLKCLTQMNPQERVVFALCYIMDVFGQKDNKKSISISFSRKEIGEIAATRSDQVSREITVLKQLNCLKTSGRKIVITDIRKMKKIISYYDIPIFNY